ncbi:hypothetical protein quinque_016187 [Culex quinquefasciatus]
MAGFVRLLLLICLINGHHQLADPDLFEGGGLYGSPFDRCGYESDVFELLPYEDRYHPVVRPPRVKLVKKPPVKVAPPLNAVQKVVLTKPPHPGSYSMPSTAGAVILALLAQAVGTVFFMILAKLLLGMKAMLATSTATLALALWSHLKKKMKVHHTKVKKIKPPKEHHKKKKKTPEVNLVQLSKKQLKKIVKLLMKKKKKSH